MPELSQRDGLLAAKFHHEKHSAKMKTPDNSNAGGDPNVYELHCNLHQGNLPIYGKICISPALSQMSAMWERYDRPQGLGDDPVSPKAKNVTGYSSRSARWRQAYCRHLLYFWSGTPSQEKSPSPSPRPDVHRNRRNELAVPAAAQAEVKEHQSLQICTWVRSKCNQVVVMAAFNVQTIVSPVSGRQWFRCGRKNPGDQNLIGQSNCLSP